MFWRSSLFISFVALNMAALAQEVSRPGDFVDPLSTSRSHPEGCDNLVHFSSTDIDAPILEGKKEFNTYYLFACPQEHLGGFVLWRTRHYQSKEQLVGELQLPRILLERHFRSGKNSELLASLGSCVGPDSTGHRVNAFIPARYASGEEIPPSKVIVAWKVEAEKMQLARIPNSTLTECFAP